MNRTIQNCISLIGKAYPNNYEYGTKMRIFSRFIEDERTDDEIIKFTEELNKK
jgi:hypothetical protein